MKLTDCSHDSLRFSSRKQTEIKKHDDKILPLYAKWQSTDVGNRFGTRSYHPSTSTMSPVHAIIPLYR